jgi:hypothetical protein
MDVLRFERWIGFGSAARNVGQIRLRAFKERKAAGGFALNEVGQRLSDERAYFIEAAEESGVCQQLVIDGNCRPHAISPCIKNSIS